MHALIFKVTAYVQNKLACGLNDTNITAILIFTNAINTLADKKPSS
jgi:hypothetical protein